MCVTIEIGHQGTNDPSTGLTKTLAIMWQVVKIICKNKLPENLLNVT